MIIFQYFHSGDMNSFNSKSNKNKRLDLSFHNTAYSNITYRVIWNISRILIGHQAINTNHNFEIILCAGFLLLHKIIYR